MYLMELLTEREPAQEVRIFGAAPFLRQRYDALTTERLRRLRTFLRARLKVALLGSAGGVLGISRRPGRAGRAAQRRPHDRRHGAHGRPRDAACSAAG